MFNLGGEVELLSDTPSTVDIDLHTLEAKRRESIPRLPCGTRSSRLAAAAARETVSPGGGRRRMSTTAWAARL